MQHLEQNLVCDITVITFSLSSSVATCNYDATVYRNCAIYTRDRPIYRPSWCIGLIYIGIGQTGRFY